MKLLLYLFCFISFYSFANDSSIKRNMMILLNQEDNCENIGKPWWHYLSCQFQSALQEKCTPILINASLVNAFVEKRQSIEQMSKIKGTDEQKALDTITDINKSLNATNSKLCAQGINPLQAKQLMLDEVNKKFYSTDAVMEAQKNSVKPISNGIAQALRSYFTKFVHDEWNIYTNEKSLYLFVPKKYAEQFPYHDTTFPRYIAKANESDAMGIFSLDATWEQKHENQLGLKLTCLTKVENIQDAARLYFDSKQENKYTIAEQLKDFFIKKTEPNYRPYEWNIVFRGHGGTWYETETDSYSQVRIADLPISDFKNVLDFCQNKVITHSFHYATCFGSGKRIQMAFDEIPDSIYNFPIISECTADGETYCMVRFFKLPAYDGKKLEEKDIAHDQDGWHLKLDNGYKWTEYFKEMSKHTFDDNLNWLPDTLDHVTENMLSNIPHIRLSHAKEFISVVAKKNTLINDQLIAYQQEQKCDSYTISGKHGIMVSSSIVPLELVFENQNNIPRILSLIAGPSKQYFRKITFDNSDHALNAFWQVPGDRFDRYFIIENVTFTNKPKSEILKNLGITQEKVILSNVLIHSQTEDILRLIFQSANGKSYMIVANKTDPFADKVSIKGVHELTPEVAQIYLSRYNQIKSEVPQNTPKAEFILSKVEGADKQVKN